MNNSSQQSDKSQPIQKVSDASWYLAASKPKQEFRAIEHLKSQQIKCFCPMANVERLLRGKKVIKQEALFPGYLFINLLVEDPNWHKVRSTRGIRDWIRFAGQVAKIPNTLVETLMDSSIDSENPIVISRFEKGQSLRILTGPFAGLKAVFDKDDGELRSMILVEFLGQTNRLKVENQQITSE